MPYQNTAPFDHLVGPLTVYIAADGTAEPDVDTTPSASWTLLGDTTGEQSIQHQGDLVMFRSNEYSGVRKTVRPEEDVILSFTLAGLTLENYARIISDAGNITTDTSPNVKRLPLARGVNPTVYALLFRGPAQSPYGNLPAQYYVPRVVQASSPTVTFGRANRAELAVEFHAIVDSSQAEGDELGWLTAQES